MRRRRGSTSLFEVLNGSKRDITKRDTTSRGAATPGTPAIEGAATGRNRVFSETGTPVGATTEPASAESSTAESSTAQSTTAQSSPSRSISGASASPSTSWGDPAVQQAPPYGDEAVQAGTRSIDTDEEFSAGPVAYSPGPLRPFSDSTEAGAFEGSSGGAGGRLGELPVSESSFGAGGAEAPEDFWAWLNRVEEVRRITLVVGGVVLFLILCVAFQTGRSFSPAGPPSSEFDFPMFTDPPDTGNGYEKEAVRNVRNGDASDGASAASEGESYEATPSGEESADDRSEGSVAPPVDPEPVWIVVVSTTESTDGRDQLLWYLDKHLEWSANMRDVSDAGRPALYEVYVGSFPTQAAADGALRRVQRLDSFAGVDFRGARVKKIRVSTE